MEVPLWHFQRAVEWKAFCTIVQNRDGNLNVPYLIENDGEVVVNWNWLDNDWNDNNPAARFATRFTSHPASQRGRVLPVLSLSNG